jgi:hypothetical protein
MISPYFDWMTIRGAAKDFCKVRSLPSLTHYAVIADEYPELELEVVVAYVERCAGLSAEYPELPANYESLLDDSDI